MTSGPRIAAAPGQPAGRVITPPALHPGAPRIVLRRSATLLAFLVCSLLIAAAAMWTALAPRIGHGPAVPPMLAFLAAGGLVAASWCRRQPRIIEIGTDTIRAFARNGTCVAEGRLTGCSQWGQGLLVMAVGAGRRRCTLLVAADSVTRAAFRELAVRGRCATPG